MDINPKSLLGLCELLDLHPSELLLNCCFCSCILDYPELWSFIHRGLNVVWKKGWPYGICLKCINFQAILDNLRNYECSAYTATVEEETGYCIDDLQVRCAGCWGLLTRVEKQWMQEYNRRYHKISGNWRGICFFCSRPPRPNRRLGPRHRRLQGLLVHPHIQTAWRR